MLEKTNSKIANEVERAQVNNYDKYGCKREAMRH